MYLFINEHKSYESDIRYDLFQRKLICYHHLVFYIFQYFVHLLNVLSSSTAFLVCKIFDEAIHNKLHLYIISIFTYSEYVFGLAHNKTTKVANITIYIIKKYDQSYHLHLLDNIRKPAFDKEGPSKFARYVWHLC